MCNFDKKRIYYDYIMEKIETKHLQNFQEISDILSNLIVGFFAKDNLIETINRDRR